MTTQSLSLLWHFYKTDFRQAPNVGNQLQRRKPLALAGVLQGNRASRVYREAEIYCRNQLRRPWRLRDAVICRLGAGDPEGVIQSESEGLSARSSSSAGRRRWTFQFQKREGIWPFLCLFVLSGPSLDCTVLPTLARGLPGSEAPRQTHPAVTLITSSLGHPQPSQADT